MGFEEGTTCPLDSSHPFSSLCTDSFSVSRSEEFQRQPRSHHKGICGTKTTAVSPRVDDDGFKFRFVLLGGRVGFQTRSLQASLRFRVRPQKSTPPPADATNENRASTVSALSALSILGQDLDSFIWNNIVA